MTRPSLTHTWRGSRETRIAPPLVTGAVCRTMYIPLVLYTSHKRKHSWEVRLEKPSRSQKQAGNRICIHHAAPNIISRLVVYTELTPRVPYPPRIPFRIPSQRRISRLRGAAGCRALIPIEARTRTRGLKDTQTVPPHGL
eukprot:3820186-Pyramimonas_sp.AAC.1